MMAIFLGSRYEGVDFTTVIDSDGNSRKFLHRRQHLSPQDITDFVVKELLTGEELDLISYNSYGDEKDYWVISDVNGIFFPLDLVFGQEIVVPSRDIKETVRNV